MPLPQAAPRKLLHMRDIQLRGYVLEDGQIEVEARMTDAKTYSAPNIDRNGIQAGEPVHDMRVRMTLTPELEITGCVASMDATPYGICPNAAASMHRLQGLKVGRGFLKAAMLRLGGVEGCTHLRELLQPIATVAFQTQHSLKHHAAAGAPAGNDAEAMPGGDNGRGLSPALLNSCYAYNESGPVVARIQEKAARAPKPAQN